MAQLLMALGASAPAMATMSQVATVAGPVFGVMSAARGIGESRQQAAEFERSAAEQLMVSQAEAEMARKEARYRQSRDLVSLAEGGALSGTGRDVIDYNAVQRELDALTIEFRGQQAARGETFRADQARKSSGVIDVFSAAVDGFSRMDPLNLTPGGTFIRGE